MNSPPSNQPSPQIIKVIWAVLTFSIIIYGFVGHLATTQIKPNPQIQVFLYALGGMAAVTTLIVMLVLPRFQDKLPFFQFCILRWALSESIAIYGFVLFFLGAGFHVFHAFLGWAIFLMLLTFPKTS